MEKSEGRNISSSEHWKKGRSFGLQPAPYVDWWMNRHRALPAAAFACVCVPHAWLFITDPLQVCYTDDTAQVPFIFKAYKIVYVLYMNLSSFIRPSASDLKKVWNTSAEKNLFLFVCGHACLLHGAESFLRSNRV